MLPPYLYWKDGKDEIYFNRYRDFSSINLGNLGFIAAENDDFEILLFAYSVDGGEVKVVDLANGENS